MSECERIQRCMNEALDGDLALDAEERLETHLASCSLCREEMDQLKSIVAGAANLPDEIETSRDLWPGIEMELARKPAWHRPSRQGIWAVAALVIIGLSVGLLWKRNPAPQFDKSTNSGVEHASYQIATIDGVRAEYRQARAELLEVVNARSGDYSTETLQVIQSNLALIDGAIDEIEKALVANPGEGRLDRQLQVAYARQIELLRWAARMPSQT